LQVLVGVALSFVPTLIDLVADDAADTLAGQAAGIVASVTGATDQAEACVRLLDPALARTLTIRLAELAVTARRGQLRTATDGEVLRSIQRQLAAVLAHAPAAPAGPAAAAPAQPPPLSNFLPCLHEVLCLEGGYSDDPRDPGGPTNFGITRAEWASVCKVPIASITPADMQQLTLKQAASVYRRFYWNALCCEDMAHGVDLMVFQFGVNAGIEASARLLEAACGVSVDGVVGPITLAATRRISPPTLIGTLADRQIGYYQTLAEWDIYGRGWTNRVDNARTVAMGMAGQVTAGADA